MRPISHKAQERCKDKHTEQPSAFIVPLTSSTGLQNNSSRKTPAIFCANLGCQRSINTSGSTVITLVPLNVSNVGLLLGHLVARLVSPEAKNGFSPRRGNVSICCIFLNSGEACLMLVLVVSLLMTWLVFVVVICSLLTQILETCLPHPQSPRVDCHGGHQILVSPLRTSPLTRLRAWVGLSSAAWVTFEL